MRLPGITQSADPYRNEIPAKTSGHACGHHLFGTASLGAAIVIKEWLENNNVKGTLRLYGTPAEEGGSGKVYMVREGLFRDVDTVLSWHPGSENVATVKPSLANRSAKFRFHGVSAHAAAAPYKARSALDGVEAFNNMTNLLREHVPQETRIHYVITKGGHAPNVVPDFAEVYYYVRHPFRGKLKNYLVTSRGRQRKVRQWGQVLPSTGKSSMVITACYPIKPSRLLWTKI